MSKGTTPRAIRISDDLWQEAKVVADRRSDTVSDVIRRALEQYIKPLPYDQ
jgi:predicted transcriptional regulator